jgi:hypothetical protein
MQGARNAEDAATAWSPQLAPLRLNSAPLVVVANGNIRRQEGIVFHHIVDLFEATTSFAEGQRFLTNRQHYAIET